MTKYKIGDLVVVKSDSERMTIEKLNEDGTYQCFWMKNGIAYRENFREAMLVEPDTGIRWSSHPKRNNHW